MEEIGTPSPELGSISGPRWSLAQRVAGSSYFRKGPKLRTFLLYVCENTLLGRLDDVHEQSIGLNVFGRRPDYNFAEDNIVRVEARELRKRLQIYFDGEGCEEPIVIEIPKGGYVPVFRARQGTESRVAQPQGKISDEAVPEAPVYAAAGCAPPRRVDAAPVRWTVVILASGLTVAIALIILLLLQGTRLQRMPAYPRGAQPGASAQDYSFYDQLLGRLGTRPERETLIILSNPKVAFVGDIVSAKTVDTQLLASRANSAIYTGIGEAVAAFHMGQLMQFLGRPVRLTQGRFLNWDHLQKLDLILLGGPRASEWSYENLPPSNFNFVDGRVVNANPLPGEQKVYREPNDPGTDFGVMKMLVSPYGFNTLLLAAVSSPGTAGVAELFANPEKMRDVYKRIGAATPPGKPFPKNWEALIRVDIRDGLPVDTFIIAVRASAAGH